MVRQVGFFVCIPAGRRREAFDLLFLHLQTDTTFDQTDQHQRDAIQAQHGPNRLRSLQKHRCDFEHGFFAAEAFFQRWLFPVGAQHLHCRQISTDLISYPMASLASLSDVVPVPELVLFLNCEVATGLARNVGYELKFPDF